MSIYVVGDIQGCFQPFQALLQKIQFNVQQDELWLVGDLVNRGPASLEVVNFLMQFPGKLHCVLGNHDLHLLATAAGVRKSQSTDTFDAILQAPHVADILRWFKQWPLIHCSEDQRTIMVHAGVFPFWTLGEALTYAKEFSDLLQSTEIHTFFEHMYGNVPTHWSAALADWERMRFIVNAFTRMRVITADGGLNLTFDSALENIPLGEKPWFELLIPEYQDKRIVFGHWAALMGRSTIPHVIALDTGCVWGRKLTAYRLEDGERFSVSADADTKHE